MFVLEMKNNSLHILIIFVFFFGISALSQTPEVRKDDKIRIAEAIAIKSFAGESIWNGINKTPIILLLVTEDFEYLFNHPYPSSDFKFLENDTITNSTIYYRKTSLPLYFQATFPAVNGVNCIVMGTPENTQSTSSEWVLTILHENFHQYQENIPYYYAGVNSLDLSGGDTSGMWMINYPFPYEDIKIIAAYNKYADALQKVVQYIDKEEFISYLSQYQKARNRFKVSLTDNDYRYFSFQLWKEGIARFTEYKYLCALKDYNASEDFRKLKDFVPLSELKSTFSESQLSNIKHWQLSEMKREIIYPLGFAEGLLLEAVNPDWQVNYFSEKFNIENTID